MSEYQFLGEMCFGPGKSSRIVEFGTVDGHYYFLGRGPGANQFSHADFEHNGISAWFDDDKVGIFFGHALAYVVMKEERDDE